MTEDRDAHAGAHQQGTGVERLAAVLGAARANFLALTPVCVLLGAASAHAGAAAAPDYSGLALALFGALLAHASVNLLNEYEDYRNGLDFQTRRTPFSGGSGALIRRPWAAGDVRIAGYVALAGTVIIGGILVGLQGVGLLPFGVLGVGLVAAYSRGIVRWPVVSLLAPGLAFGPLMVLGTAYVAAGGFTLGGLMASLVPFFLVNGLLLLNQFPDVEADRGAGRRNLPILCGRRASALVVAVFLVMAYTTIGVGVMAGHWSTTAAAALVPGLAAPLVAVTAYRRAEDMDRLVPALGWNVAITLATPLVLALGLLLAMAR